MKHEIAVTLAVGLVVGTLLSTTSAAGQFNGNRCAFETEVSAQMAASESDRLRVSSKSGSLVVEGRAGLAAVMVTATMCASEESILEDMDVVLERRGSTVDLETDQPLWAFRGDGYALIDLRIEVPLGMETDIDDGSGSITLSGLGDVTVDDGSGDIYVEDIQGSVEIDDGSGGVDIVDVQGDVFVDDGSGSIDIVGVQGSVTVDDGSGSVDISDVGQNVVAYDIGSGTFRVSRVQGDLIVENGREDRIRYSDVQGLVDIPEPRRRRNDG